MNAPPPNSRLRRVAFASAGWADAFVRVAAGWLWSGWRAVDSSCRGWRASPDPLCRQSEAAHHCLPPDREWMPKYERAGTRE